MNPAEIDAAKLLLARLGFRPEDLIGSADRARPIPTFSEYVDDLQAAVPPGTRRAYGPYWHRIVNEWGHRRLTEPTHLEIREIIERTKQQAVVRRNSRGGRSAAEHMVNALRALYRQAEADGHIPQADNPAQHIVKPRRLPNNRRAIPDHLLAEINRVAASTGNDPELDTLILRLHIETACRRSGALALRPQDLDREQCLIQLREKGGTTRWQPVSPTLMASLIQHIERGAAEGEQLLRYRTGAPITGRRYDYIWNRIGKHLRPVATQQITAHWLRHTTLTWVERHFGYAVARAFAGHAEFSGHAGATLTYVRATVQEVSDALAAMTGENHPMASPRDNSSPATAA
ncbi:tyrosine-type recombinase/integrase [Nocardia sp. NPDC058640]|uniref:tyrosine-type recombinase/integrase n=1 Tax=Nocardia sp. NPDC058640 TaxID=3346571 RepID=UPI003650E8A8